MNASLNFEVEVRIEEDNGEETVLYTHTHVSQNFAIEEAERFFREWSPHHPTTVSVVAVMKHTVAVFTGRSDDA